MKWNSIRAYAWRHQLTVYLLALHRKRSIFLFIGQTITQKVEARHAEQEWITTSMNYVNVKFTVKLIFKRSRHLHSSWGHTIYTVILQALTWLLLLNLSITAVLSLVFHDTSSFTHYRCTLRYIIYLLIDCVSACRHRPTYTDLFHHQLFAKSSI